MSLIRPDDDLPLATTLAVVAVAAAIVLALTGCAPIPPPVPPDPPTPPSVRTVALVVIGNGAPLSGAVCSLEDIAGFGPHSGVTNGDGYVAWNGVAASLTDTAIHCKAAGYVQLDQSEVLKTTGNENLPVATMTSEHVDPSGIPLGVLAAIRGAMWPARMTIGYGPRPGSPDNILAMDFYQLYDAPTRAAMLTTYKGYGYTHAVTGPLSGTDCYHGDYPCHDQGNPGWFPQDGAPSQAQWDFYLDRLQEWWDAGVAPIVFIHPDGWTFEQTRDVFTPLLQQPRAQRLIRIAVGSGWEPTRYDWSSCTWALFGQWVRTTLPNALSLIHTVTDVDAPAGTDALCNDEDHAWNPDGNAGAWRRVAPYVHGWLIQNGPYYTSPTDDPSTAWNFAAQFLESGDGATAHSVAWHFAGNAGWPTTSAWGNRPVCLYNAENTSYAAYWKNLPMAASVAWGNLAMSGASVACGYLDAGSVPVQVRR